MTTIRRALVCGSIAWAVGGCTVGVGSAYVGQWKARDVVDFEACLENEAGRCVEQKRVETHLEARRFWGFMISYPAMGVAFTSIDGRERTRFRMEPTAEYLRGKGRFAVGLRAGVLLDPSDREGLLSTPIMAMGHFGLADRLSLYGGAGMSPLTQLKSWDPAEADGAPPTTHTALRGLAGLQLVISQSDESHFLLSVEVDTFRASFGDVDYRSTGLVAALGIFL